MSDDEDYSAVQEWLDRQTQEWLDRMTLEELRKLSDSNSGAVQAPGATPGASE